MSCCTWGKGTFYNQNARCPDNTGSHACKFPCVLQVSDPPDGPAYSQHLKHLQQLMMTVNPNK